MSSENSIPKTPVFYERRPNLLTRTLDGEVVILDNAAGRIHQLNASASCIWNACDGTRSSADIAALVAEEFGADLTTVVKDVETTLAELQSQGLLIAAQNNDGTC